jgi:alpha-ribazole phosphatase/probable phosphoglycerate mutase
VNNFLRQLLRDHDRSQVIIVGHRGTWYALEHLLRGAPLESLVSGPWIWQPGLNHILEAI